MRFNVYSPHWQDGGTGITNFFLAELALYDEAVRRYVEKTGDRSYIVCSAAMGGDYTSQKIKDTMGSLHRHSSTRLPGRAQECADFWKVFYEVKNERDAKEAAKAAFEKAAEERVRAIEIAEARIRMAREVREEKLRAILQNPFAGGIIAQEKLHVRLGRWHVTLVVDADGKLHVKSELLTPFQEKILQADRNSTPINTTTPGDYSGFFKHRV